MNEKEILTVVYDGDLNEKLDDAIITLVCSFGYLFYASGYNFDDETRDLAFEKKD